MPSPPSAGPAHRPRAALGLPGLPGLWEPRLLLLHGPGCTRTPVARPCGGFSCPGPEGCSGVKERREEMSWCSLCAALEDGDRQRPPRIPRLLGLLASSHPDCGPGKRDFALSRTGKPAGDERKGHTPSAVTELVPSPGLDPFGYPFGDAPAHHRFGVLSGICQGHIPTDPTCLSAWGASPPSPPSRPCKHQLEMCRAEQEARKCLEQCPPVPGLLLSP